MLIEKFKKNTSRAIVLGIIGLISLVFVFVGVFPAATSIVGDTNVAAVGDEVISIQEFQRAYNREMQAFQQFGDKIPPFFLMQIRDRVVNNLVQQRLILLEAQRLGLYVSDEEVRDEIAKQEVFLDENKKFDLQRYRDILKANRLTPQRFEAQLKDDLKRQKLVQFLQSRIRVTETELRREYEVANTKRDLEFVRLRNEDAFEKMKVSKAEVDAYLADETKKNLARSHYDGNIRKYKKEDEICARHILNSKKELEAAPEDFASLKPNTKNFASLAEKHSDGPTKTRGGDLGCFGRGVMDKSFETAAFGLKKGEITAKPVKSQFGWHYIYVYDRKPGFERKFEEVQAEIARELIKKTRKDEIQKINRQEAERIAAKWSSGSKSGLNISATGEFTRVQSAIPSIGRASEIMEAAFNPDSQIQSRPQIFEAAGGVIIAKVKKAEEPDFTKFESDRKKQLETLQTRKLRIFFPAWVESVKEEFPVKVNEKLIDEIVRI